VDDSARGSREGSLCMGGGVPIALVVTADRGTTPWCAPFSSIQRLTATPGTIKVGWGYLGGKVKEYSKDNQRGFGGWENGKRRVANWYIVRVKLISKKNSVQSLHSHAVPLLF
jgi:hypothetical protein